jgi:hypothetical protein
MYKMLIFEKILEMYDCQERSYLARIALPKGYTLKYGSAKVATMSISNCSLSL